MQIISKKFRSIVAVLFALILCVLSSAVSAEIIDDIILKTDANGEVDAIIKLTVPIQKLRYFPTSKSQFLVIYFNILYNESRDQWQDYESHRSPPSDLIVDFHVTTRDLNTGPKIEIKFNRPAEYTLTAGRDNRSLKIHIKPEKPLQSKENKPVPALSGGVVLAPNAPPVTAAVPSAALPAAAATPIVVVPTVALPGVSATTLNPSPAQLGGKDGLPVFPQIEQVAQVTGDTQSSGDITLADQIKKTNSEAALLMAKGRDALLAGEMFAAIDAFNNTLKLPPNKYSPDAQLWIGIAREKSGQQAKAKLEYDTYLKLYPTGTGVKWVKERLARLNALQPSPAPLIPQTDVVAQKIDYQTTMYGSYSMYYYHGASHTDTISTVGNVQSPSSLTVTDQSSLITNLSMTARSYNAEYDNRLVFQEFYAANFLPSQENNSRLNAAFYELKSRAHDFSARIGRQSALGGGVLGRFDGVSGGYGFLHDWRANVVAGRLSDLVIGDKPVFYGASMDFAVRSPLGGTFYAINQSVGGITDRKAVGGNLRYFDPRKTAIAMVDYDTQFRDFNLVTLQGTLNGESGTDYNFLFDVRKTPSLSIRSAVNGTPSTIDTLMQNGWTQDDLIMLAKQRTAISNTAQFGVTSHIKEKWQIATDLIVTNISGMPESGTLNPDGTTGLEGYVPGSPASGNVWTISERLMGSDVFISRDLSMCSLSLTKSPMMTGKTLILNSHMYIREPWILDSTLRLYWQNDIIGSKQSVIAPMLKVGYQVKSYLTLEAEGGIEWTTVTPSAMEASKINRQYFSLGFRWDF